MNQIGKASLRRHGAREVSLTLRPLPAGRSPGKWLAPSLLSGETTLARRLQSITRSITHSLRFFALLPALLLAVLPAACGSSAQTSALICPSGEYQLMGTLDGQAVDVTASSDGSGLSQVGTGSWTWTQIRILRDRSGHSSP